MAHHLEPDNLECEVKWALRSITMNKASGGDGIPAELFKILKDAVKMLHSVCQQIWKTQQWSQDWKSSIFTPVPKKGNAKKCPGYSTVVLTLYASKVMLKVLQARLQYMNRELQIYKLGLEKAEDQRSNRQHLLNHRESRASLLAQTIKSPPVMWETWVQSLVWEDRLEDGMATHSSILGWGIPMDRGTWWATVLGVTKSWTCLDN